MMRWATMVKSFWRRTSPSGDCIVWTSTRDKRGYGRVTWQGRSKLASRLAWELTHGPIPEGMFVCHHCDNPPCVNPAHLFVGTHSDNMADMVAKGRSRRGENAGPARLTNAEAEEIRKARDGGESCTAIARRFGVSMTTVSTITNNRRRVDPARYTPPFGARGRKTRAPEAA